MRTKHFGTIRVPEGGRIVAMNPRDNADSADGTFTPVAGKYRVGVSSVAMMGELRPILMSLYLEGTDRSKVTRERTAVIKNSDGVVGFFAKENRPSFYSDREWERFRRQTAYHTQKRGYGQVPTGAVINTKAANPTLMVCKDRDGNVVGAEILLC